MIETRGARPPGEWYVDGDDFVFAGLDLGNVFVAIQPPRGYGENPVAIYHDPEPRARPPLPRDLPLARRSSAPTRSCTSASTARSSGCRARRSGCRDACAPDACLRRRAALLPVRRQRPRRGHAGQAPRPRRRDRPPRAADDARRDLRRAGPARAAARRVRALPRRSTRPSCRRSPNRIWTLLHEAELHRDLDVDERAARRSRTSAR